MDRKRPYDNIETLVLKKRGRGRPRRDTVAIFVRVPRAEAEMIDEWRKAQTGGPIGRPEAVRRLARLGLGKAKLVLRFKGPSRAVSTKTAAALAKLPRR